MEKNEFVIPKSPQSLESCSKFKSTFARSLSFNTNNQPNKPLDMEISFRIGQNIDATTIGANILQNENEFESPAIPLEKNHKVDEDFNEILHSAPKQSEQNAPAKLTTLPTPTQNNNAIASHVSNTTCFGRHQFQVKEPFNLIFFCLILTVLK